MASEKSQEVIRLHYRREPNTELFTGTLLGAPEEFKFSAVTFAQMFGMVGSALRSAPTLRLVIKREEAPYPSSLPASLEDLLRSDTPAAINALTIAPQKVVISAPRPRPRALVTTIRQGHSTLADAIGEDVYLNAKVNTLADEWLHVEDPVSGRWASAKEQGGLLYCGKLSIQFILDTDSKWAKARVINILELGAPRYYLPRRWNPTGRWITHDALSNLYSQYKKEKANVSDK